MNRLIQIILILTKLFQRIFFFFFFLTTTVLPLMILVVMQKMMVVLIHFGNMKIVEKKMKEIFIQDIV